MFIIYRAAILPISCMHEYGYYTHKAVYICICITLYIVGGASSLRIKDTIEKTSIIKTNFWSQ